jgi:tetratricopeptide (TPR) repeat protein
MVVRLSSGLKKVAVMLLACGSFAGVAFAASRYLRVEWLSRAGTQDSLRRALQAQPADADLHNKLGRILLYSPESDSAQAEQHLSRATALDPYNGLYWADLALAREMRGDLDGSWQALAAARKAEPSTPQFRWLAMNYLLRRGELDRAVEEARLLLREAPDYTGRAIPVLANAVPMDRLITSTVPASSRALCDLLAVISRSRDHAGASKAWDTVMGSGVSLRSTCVRPFMDTLISGGDAAVAQRVWRDSIGKGWLEADASALHQPLYNADFRYPVLNYGFDWRVIPHAEASTWIEAQGPEPGMQSLCVEFSADARTEYANMLRYVAVEPETEYLLLAFVRSDRLVSRQGAHLQVLEVASRGAPPKTPVYARSESWSGTNRWKEVAFRFATGPQTRMLTMQLRRPGALPNEPPASGLTCLSAVEWRMVGPASRTASAAARPSVTGGTP